MGIGIHELSALSYAKKFGGPFVKTATLGRQAFVCFPQEIQKHLGISGAYTGYCEELLKDHYGSTDIHSFDASVYEGATNILDLSDPLLNTSLIGKFNTVIDFGTIEHVFNPSQALINVAKMTKAGGQIIHSLPANSFCGHGFYQFSPELFFAFYSEENGFTNTRVFIADYTNNRYWYEVEKPRGKRVEFASKVAIGCIVHTVKLCEKEAKNVYQSDYIQTWEKPVLPPVSITTPFLKQLIRKSPLLKSLLITTYLALKPKFRELFAQDCTLFKRHPKINRVSLKDLLRPHT